MDNGYVYEGDANQDGVFDGNGFLYDSLGRIIYHGSWKNGKYDGYGTFNKYISLKHNDTDNQPTYKNLQTYQQLWTKYEGEFKNGELNGFGTFYYLTD